MAKRTLRRLRLLTGAGLGAAAMYFFDPQLGRGRRTRARDRLQARLRRARDDAERARRYEVGVAEGRRHGEEPESPPADDRALADRIRSQLGPDFPHARVTLNVVDSVVDLRGELDDHVQIEHLVGRVRAVPGVIDVVSFLHLPGTPAPNKLAAERAGAGAGIVRREAPPTTEPAPPTG
jgi:hypothetical protein